MTKQADDGMGEYSSKEIAQRMQQTFDVCGDVWFKRAAAELTRLRAEVERLQKTLKLARLYIKDQMIADAIVVVDGKFDSNGPSLLQVIDAALAAGGNGE